MKPKTRARLERSARHLLSLNNICVINLNEPYYLQTTFNHKTARQVNVCRETSKAISKTPHKWTLYLAVFCQSDSETYTKAIEVTPQGIYKAEHLTDVIEQFHTSLVKGQNPSHIQSSGWIAFPYPMELDEEEADRLFESAKLISKHFENIRPPEAHTI